jgi:hypothetical protein
MKSPDSTDDRGGGEHESPTMLPSRYSIDYEAVLSDAKGHGSANISLVLKERLPSVWRDVYLITISHEPNLIRFRHHTFDYICDVYSQLELAGSVPFDQTIADRVIGVLGTSSRHSKIVVRGASGSN